MDKKLTPAEIVIVASGLAVFIFSQVHWSSSPAIAASSVVLVGFALIIGLVIAARISGRTSVGPGRKKRPNM